LLQSIEHPAGRRRDQDIEAGQSERTFDKHARGRAQTASPHEHAAEDFAAALAGDLRRGRLEHGVDRIVLVAEPHFLGLVRGKLDDSTAKLALLTVPKDLVDFDANVLQDHLADVPAF
jgi:protein required for attachment to host cells